MINYYDKVENDFGISWETGEYQKKKIQNKRNSESETKVICDGTGIEYYGNIIESNHHHPFAHMKFFFDVHFVILIFSFCFCMM